MHDHTLESRVSSDIQTPQSWLKKLGYCLVFQFTSRCLDIWWNTFSLVWCIRWKAYRIRIFLDVICNTSLVSRKAKSTLLAACVFYAFLNSRNILRVWISVSKHGNPFGISYLNENLLHVHTKFPFHMWNWNIFTYEVLYWYVTEIFVKAVLLVYVSRSISFPSKET